MSGVHMVGTNRGRGVMAMWSALGRGGWDVDGLEEVRG